ncbi:hypothetical protein [uncultured Brevundimonas sp.]|uniref:hypothetical protein n=1 Tax=uncultured Brevundimonas sp. TaxID=213418 RepID=UPI0030EE829D|tara:strand:- start:1966 stop:2922 length:957 start_codon:yes stop_codon:yes gene_type:complete
MLAFVVAALLGSSLPQSVPAAAPPADATRQQPEDGATVTIGDVEIIARPRGDTVREFVNEVAAPNRNRGIARWEKDVCIGVANLRGAAAQYIVDRMSAVALDIGLTPGEPGCEANVIVIASDAPDRVAEELVNERLNALIMGGSGMDQGRAALNAFASSDRPVRWWQISMPIDSQTGAAAIRLPSECGGSCTGGADFGPKVRLPTSTRLSSPIVDSLIRTVIIVDLEQARGVTVQQLADYLAMVTLAQIDPEADTHGFQSVLNVFESPASVDGLTEWDQTYLRGLYRAHRTRNIGSGLPELSDSIRRIQARESANAPD